MEDQLPAVTIDPSEIRTSVTSSDSAPVNTKKTTASVGATIKEIVRDLFQTIPEDSVLSVHSTQIPFPELAFLSDAEAFDDERLPQHEGIYVLDNGYYGVIVEVEKIDSALSPAQQTGFHALIKEVAREDSYLSFVSYTSPDFGDLPKKLRENCLGEGVSKAYGLYLADYIEDQTTSFNGSPAHQFPIHDSRFLIAFKAKASIEKGEVNDGNFPTRKFLASMVRRRLKMTSLLQSAGFEVNQVSPESHCRFMDTLFNWKLDADWRTPRPPYDPNFLMRHQFVDIDTEIEESAVPFKQGSLPVIQIKEEGSDRAISVLTTREYRDEHRPLAELAAGVVWSKDNPLFRYHHLLSSTVYFKKAKRHIQNKQSDAGPQEDLADSLPVFNSVLLSTSIAVIAPSDRIARATEETIKYFDPVVKFEASDGHLRHLLSMTPFGATNLYRTMHPNTSHKAETYRVFYAIPFLGASKGCSAGRLSGFSRTGQIVKYDFSRTEAGAHAIGLGSSGTGRPFVVTQAVYAAALVGGAARVLESKAATDKMMGLLGGEYLDGGLQSLRVDPFASFQNDEFPHKEARFKLLIELLYQMFRSTGESLADENKREIHTAATSCIASFETCSMQGFFDHLKLLAAEGSHHAYLCFQPFIGIGLYAKQFEPTANACGSFLGQSIGFFRSMNGSIRNQMGLLMALLTRNAIDAACSKKEGFLVLSDVVDLLTKDYALELMKGVFEFASTTNLSIVVSSRSASSYIDSPWAQAFPRFAVHRYLTWPADTSPEKLLSSKIFDSFFASRDLFSFWLAKNTAYGGKQESVQYTEVIYQHGESNPGIIRLAAPKFLSRYFDPKTDDPIAEVQQLLLELESMGYHKIHPEMMSFAKYFRAPSRALPQEDSIKNTEF